MVTIYQRGIRFSALLLRLELDGSPPEKPAEITAARWRAMVRRALDEIRNPTPEEAQQPDEVRYWR